MNTSNNLFLTEEYGIINRWVVVDAEDFCLGEGETPDDAIQSARIRSNAPIETYWGIVSTNSTDLPEVEQ